MLCGLRCFAPLLAALLLAPRPGVAQPPAPRGADAEVIYVVRRGWHVEVGFTVADMEPPLNSVAKQFPGVRYLFFGFGDRRYFLAKDRNAPVLLAALWPGPGMILVTALGAPPQDAFGASQVVSLAVARDQAHGAQAFVWQSLEKQASDETEDSVQSYAPGPYDGSLYFSTPLKYSAAHTCNTWVAEALKAAALPIRSRGVVFAGQLWSQVQRLERTQGAAAQEAAAAPSSRLRAHQSQGGFVPSWQTTVVPEF
jgi:hypothetical protein